MHSEEVDVVIVGGGHNGLVSAAYLAKAGLRVKLLEKLDVLGGAAISTKAFEGIDAKLSRYSYLVSLLPKQIIEDLGLEVELAPRRYSSFTPDPFGDKGLLIDKLDQQATRRSFAELGAEADFDSWNDFYSKTELIAQKLFPTVMQPLKSQEQVRKLLGEELWQEFFAQPIGKTIEKYFESDLVRGVVMTDALIGTFAPNDDVTLASNKCFLYHVIGNETGDWNIPVGGMGSVTSSMREAAQRFGAELQTEAEVLEISQDRVVTYRQGGALKTLKGRFILANLAAPKLHDLLGQTFKQKIQGAQVKVNMLLKRLPKLKSGEDSQAAFGGTFHINENYSQLQAAFGQASAGEIPSPLPCEIYCHSLTDPSILSQELKNSGVQTLTVFALHTPHSLLEGRDNDEMRGALEKAVIDSLNSVLAEPIQELLLVDGNGKPCIETKTTQDLEDALGLPGGNIFHASLSWPFLENATAETIEEQWGVDSGFQNIFYCGSTARRGGAVSGIAGHNAAMAVLQSRKLVRK